MGKSSNGGAMCTACEMAVVWMGNKLRKNETEEQILDYVNSVSYYFYASWTKNLKSMLKFLLL